MHNMIWDDERGPYGLAGKIPVKIGTRIRLIDPANIVYAKSCGDYVDISLASGEVLHTKEQITRLESRLPADLFARVHRSYVVNTGYIKEIRARQNGYELVLTNETLVAASSTYRYQIRDRVLLNPRRAVATDGARDWPGGRGSAQQAASPEEGDGGAGGLQVRLCAPGDEHELALIGQATFMETFTGQHAAEDILTHCATRHSPRFYREWLQDPAVRIWVMERSVSGAPVGYMAVTPVGLPLPDCGADELEIQRIYLREGWYGRDIEARLFAEGLRYAQERGSGRLWTSNYVQNDKILEFCTGSGFKPHAEYMCRVGAGEYRDIALSLEV